MIFHSYSGVLLVEDTTIVVVDALSIPLLLLIKWVNSNDENKNVYNNVLFMKDFPLKGIFSEV
jgi:hypothetical protein